MSSIGDPSYFSVRLYSPDRIFIKQAHRKEEDVASLAQQSIPIDTNKRKASEESRSSGSQLSKRIKRDVNPVDTIIRFPAGEILVSNQLLRKSGADFLINLAASEFREKDIRDNIEGVVTLENEDLKQVVRYLVFLKSETIVNAYEPETLIDDLNWANYYQQTNYVESLFLHLGVAYPDYLEALFLHYPEQFESVITTLSIHRRTTEDRQADDGAVFQEWLRDYVGKWGDPHAKAVKLTEKAINDHLKDGDRGEQIKLECAVRLINRYKIPFSEINIKKKALKQLLSTGYAFKKSLEYANFTGLDWTDADLETCLYYAENIRQLALDSKNCTGSFLACLKAKPIESISLSGVNVSRARFLDPLAGLPLKAISLSCRFRDDNKHVGAKEGSSLGSLLEGMPLEFLSLDDLDAAFSPESLCSLLDSRKDTLKSLELGNAGSIAVADLEGHLPQNLERLALKQFLCTGESPLKILKGLDRLKTFAFCGCGNGIPADDFQFLPASLEELEISGDKYLSEGGVHHFKRLVNLKSIVLSNCPIFNDTALRSLPLWLQKIALAGCRSVTAEGRDYLNGLQFKSLDVHLTTAHHPVGYKYFTD